MLRRIISSITYLSPTGQRTMAMPASRSASSSPMLLITVATRSEEHTSEFQSQFHLVCRLLLEKKKGNHLAVDLLREAIEEANPETASLAIDALTAAVNSNPGNVSLINLLARVHAKAGRIDDAARLYLDSSATPPSEVYTVSLHVALPI